MEVLGIGGMDKDMQEIAAVTGALQGIKTQLKAYQSNPTDPSAVANLIAAMKALTAASQLPLPPGASYLSSELQSAVQLVATLGNLPVTLPSCSSSDPNPIYVRDYNGNPINLAEFMNHPEYTYNFTCHLKDGPDSFRPSDWATQFHPGMITGRFTHTDPHVDTVGGIQVNLGDHTCSNSLEVNAQGTGTQLNSLCGIQMNGAASSQISTFINSLV